MIKTSKKGLTINIYLSNILLIIISCKYKKIKVKVKRPAGVKKRDAEENGLKKLAIP